MSKLFIFFIISLLSTIFIGCNEKGKMDSGINETSDSMLLHEQIISDSGLRIFTLPAPLQMATSFKVLNFEYNESLIVPTKKAKSFYSSNYLSGLNLGICTIDLAYCTVYENQQRSLEYIKVMQRLMEEMGLSSAIEKNMEERFATNLKNQDSLYHIILDSYEKSHNYFRENKREQIGFFILSGAFIEGLYLTLNQKQPLENIQIKKLIGQQKIFLGNVIELLQYFEPEKEMLDLYNKMKIVEHSFKPFQVQSNENKNGKVLINCEFKDEDLKALLKNVSQIRDQIVNS